MEQVIDALVVIGAIATLVWWHVWLDLRDSDRIERRSLCHSVYYDYDKYWDMPFDDFILWLKRDIYGA